MRDEAHFVVSVDTLGGVPMPDELKVCFYCMRCRQVFQNFAMFCTIAFVLFFSLPLQPLISQRSHYLKLTTIYF